MTDFGARRCRLARLPRTWARRLPSSSLPILWLLVALLALTAAAQPALAAKWSLCDEGAGGNVTGDPDDGEHKPASAPVVTQPGSLGVEVQPSQTLSGPAGSAAGAPSSSGVLPASATAPAAYGSAYARSPGAIAAPWRWLELIAIPVGGHLLTPLPFLLLGNTRS